MPDKRISFRCYHPDCAGEPPLQVVVEVPSNPGASGAKKQKLVYCERNHPNLINIPASWSVKPLVFGDDGVIGFNNGVPVVQGQQP